MANENVKGKINVALTGNPNCGKTTIYNSLTGDNQAVGNYSGVTVDKIERSAILGDTECNFVDLPGVYSLTTFSKDEQVARDYLLSERPDYIVNVVDASNLERNLFLTLQLKELGLPLVIVFNMCDLAKARGIAYDIDEIKATLKAPIIEVIGSKGLGLDQLRDMFANDERLTDARADSGAFLQYSEKVEKALAVVESSLDDVALDEDRDASLRSKQFGTLWLISGKERPDAIEKDVSYESVRSRADVVARRRWLAIKILEEDKVVAPQWNDSRLKLAVENTIKGLSESSTPIAALFAAERYAIVRDICNRCVKNEKRRRVLISDRADRILTHPFWGLIIFFIAMYLVFWLTFAIGNYPVRWLEILFERLANCCNDFWSGSHNSLLRSMIVDGVIGGVGSVLAFFPNIFILFAAIALLEESGYMARGAFLTDRFLRRFGLSGKSFIPMLVGFGCSVPAVMSTRIIEDRKSRLLTIFVVPLMSCGARFPIYVLIIPAFFPEAWQAPVLWAVYFAGIVVAAAISTVLSKTLFRNENSPLLIELPPYHAPTLKTVGRRALERGWQYVRKAGTTILGVSLALWAASTFPVLPQSELASYEESERVLLASAEELGVDLSNREETLETSDSSEQSLAEDADSDELENARREKIQKLQKDWEDLENSRAERRLEYSVSGRIGKACEPIIKYAGFDWRIGAALVGALAAKEIFVAQLGIVFKVGEADENSKPLRESFRENYVPLVGVSIIIFCLIGAPCLATFVVVAKETSYRWAFAQWTTLTITGFVFAVIAYQLGSLFHWGT